MKRTQPEWNSHEIQVTRAYAYLLQQIEEALDLAKYIWGRFEIDDNREWQHAPDVDDVHQSIEKAALYFRSSVQARTRKQTFSYLIFCQAYNGLDTYVNRVLGHAPRHYHSPNKSISQLEKRRYDLQQHGISFLTNEQDYQRVNTIRNCRNLITHNQGVITPEFNHSYPAIQPGVGQRIILYPTDVADDIDFLIHECFNLDGNAALRFNIRRKTFAQWQDDYGAVEGYGTSDDTVTSDQT